MGKGEGGKPGRWTRTKNPNRKTLKQLNDLNNMNTHEEEKLIERTRRDDRNIVEEKVFQEGDSEEEQYQLDDLAKPQMENDQLIEILNALLTKKVPPARSRKSIPETPSQSPSSTSSGTTTTQT